MGFRGTNNKHENNNSRNIGEIMKYAYFNNKGLLDVIVETSGKIEEKPLKVVNVTNVTEKFNAIDKDGNLIWIGQENKDQKDDPKTQLEKLKENKLFEIRQKFQGIVDFIKSQYAPYEIESFADQRAEWRAWMADNTAKTPIVDALAQARGIDREVLLQRIGEKVTQIVQLQGTQNRIEDSVKMLNDVEGIEAVNVDEIVQSVMEHIA